jgi:hypothetical protein
MSHTMKQLQLIILPTLNKNINSLISAFRAKSMVNLSTTEEQRSLQLLKVVLFQESRMCKAADLTGTVCEGVADVGSTEAVSALSDSDGKRFQVYHLPYAGIFGIGLAVLHLGLRCPFWYFYIGECAVFGFPLFEIKAWFACLGVFPV